MTASEHLVVIDAVQLPKTAASLFSSVKSLTNGIASWVQSCVDYWAAAALYDSLRTLSDAELQRRGFSRDTLLRDVFQSCDLNARSKT
jgi:hypothetical protein